MTNRARPGLAHATIWNLSGLLLPVVIQLVTVPLYIRVIGTDRYGMMALVWLLLGYFGVFDLGFGRAIASRIAHLGETAPALRERIFWTGTCLSLLTGLFGSLILYAAAAKLFHNVFAVPPELLRETTAALPYIALSLPVVTGISALSGALQGREAFAAMNIAQLTGSILYQIFPLLVGLTLSVQLPYLVLAAIMGRLVTAVMLLGFCLTKVPARKLPRLARAEIRPLLAYGGWVTLTGLISPLLTVFDRFVIGTLTGMQAVAAYSIPYNLVMRIAALPASLQNALFPRFAMVNETEAKWLQDRAVAAIASLMAPLLIIGLLLMKPFLMLWLGARLAGVSAPVGESLLIGLWFNTLAFIPFAHLQSRNRPDLPAKFHVAELLVYAPALYFLIRGYGVAGAAWAWDTRAAMDAVLLFAATRSLPGLWHPWPGFALLVAAFCLVTYVAAGTAIYWGAGLALTVISVIWAMTVLPPDLRRGIQLKWQLWRVPRVAS